jgi:predicted nucleic-acid-binding protein
MPFHEIFAGVTSSFIISPIMSIIDISILRSQLQKEKISKSIVNNITFYSNNKSKFIKPLVLMNVVYCSTYCTANLTELYCKKNNIDYKLPTLFSTSFVNILTISYKDMIYSKLLKNTLVTIPLRSKFLLAMRDIMTINACFIWKKDLINYLDKYMMHNKSEIISSIFVPSTIQIISTPIHILAIDIYEKPYSNFVERLKNIKLCYKSVLFGRIFRAIPAFGIGSFINDMLRPINNYEFR